MCGEKQIANTPDEKDIEVAVPEFLGTNFPLCSICYC